ncbi:MAG: ASCH domain-containing protein [Candidatus Berkelbacteria bacterium]
MKKHIAIFVGSAIEDIFVGKKTIESRFSQNRVLPYGEVAKDDIILLKKSGGDILGQVTVDNVLYYDKLNQKSIEVLKKEYFNQIAVRENFWQSKKNSKYGTLIFLKNPKRFVFPLQFKKKDRRPWLISDKKIQDKKKP